MSSTPPWDWTRTGDAGGSFNNDTECVNGPRGYVADHRTKDVPPYVSGTFGVQTAN